MIIKLVNLIILPPVNLGESCSLLQGLLRGTAENATGKMKINN